MLWHVLTQLGAAIAVSLAVLTAKNLRSVLEPDVDPAEVGELVSVLVPLRNESAHVDALVLDLMDQTALADVEILLIDDNSTDDTRTRLDHWAEQASNIRVFQAEPLADGWLGKPAACAQVARHARGEVLVFVDADVRLAPHALASAVSLLQEHRLDWVSPYPRQLALTWSERLTQPLVQWLWMATLPYPWAYRAPFPSTAIANGQFLTVRAQAYQAAGGHTGVRDRVLDDVALAQNLRRAGFHGGAVNGSSLASCRMYTDWSQVHRGYQKSLWAAFPSAPAALVVGVIFALTYLLPVLAMFQGSYWGLLAFMAGVWSRYAVAERMGDRSLPDAVAHPVSILMLLGLLASSWIAKWRGTLTWKGRTL